MEQVFFYVNCRFGTRNQLNYLLSHAILAHRKLFRNSYRKFEKATGPII
jgi:hypothetical protein